MKLFVWDFHGVLEQDNEKAVIQISNAILKKNGFVERFSDDDVDKLYGLKWYQYFEYLLPDLSLDECKKLQADCLENQKENREIITSIIKPSKNALTVLSAIKKSRHHQIVISNTHPNDITWFLDAVGIRKFFNDDQIFGVNAHQTHGCKSDALKSYMDNNNFEQVVCIGDSVADMELGRSVGAVNYFYKHPHRHHESTDLADYYIKDLAKLKKEI